MKKKSDGQSAFFNLRLLIGLFVFVAGIVLTVFGSSAFANAFAQARWTKSAVNIPQGQKVIPQSRDEGTGQNFWAQTNGPQGGDGIALATNPSGHVFVGTQGGGIFRSSDNGETWAAVNNGLTDTNVRALAINAAGHIFGGTWSSGVFRSTD